MYRYVGFLAAIFENRAWRWSLQFDLLYIYKLIHFVFPLLTHATVKTPGVLNCRSLIVRVCSLPSAQRTMTVTWRNTLTGPYSSIRRACQLFWFTSQEDFAEFLASSSPTPQPPSPFYRHRSPKKFTNTDEPPTLSSPPHQFPISSPDCEQAVRAQWGPCHGSACPRTKDNCDLEQTWGWGESGVKAKVKSSFSSSALRFTYNTTGTKSCSYLRMKKKEGEVIIRFTMEVGVEGAGWLPGNKEWK